MARDLTLDIGEITLEGATPDEAERLRAVIERALAQVARQLAGSEGAGANLGDLRLDLGPGRDLLAPRGEAELAQRLLAAIRAGWEAAR